MRRERLGLALEAGQAVGVGRDRVRQDFHGHVAVEAIIARKIHLAHATVAQLGEDLIRAETIPGLHRSSPGLRRDHAVARTWYVRERRRGSPRRCA